MVLLEVGHAPLVLSADLEDFLDIAGLQDVLDASVDGRPVHSLTCLSIGPLYALMWRMKSRQDVTSHAVRYHNAMSIQQN